MSIEANEASNDTPSRPAHGVVVLSSLLLRNPIMQTLILLPGLLCDAALWAHQTRYLADLATIRVADLTQDETVEAMAARVLDAAPATFAMAALSMGGYAAFAILRAAPDRVTRLALLDTSARPDTEEQVTRRKLLMQLAQRGQFKGVTPKLLPLLVHPDRVEEQPLAGEVTAMAERVGKEAFLRQQRAIMARPDSRPLLPMITVPTMVICGRQDALTPLDRSEEMAAAIPAAKLAVIEECGHLSTMERPHAVTALMRLWLGGQV
jgi:pimeloyl-ACP methyl ester carboxylesterase